MSICKIGVTFILLKEYWIKQILLYTQLIYGRGVEFKTV